MGRAHRQKKLADGHAAVAVPFQRLEKLSLVVGVLVLKVRALRLHQDELGRLAVGFFQRNEEIRETFFFFQPSRYQSGCTAMRCDQRTAFTSSM